MEESKVKKKKRLAPTVILIFVIVSSILIVMELTANISTEIEAKSGGIIDVSTSEPTPFVPPTRDPDYTAEPIVDA